MKTFEIIKFLLLLFTPVIVLSVLSLTGSNNLLLEYKWWCAAYAAFIIYTSRGKLNYFLDLSIFILKIKNNHEFEIDEARSSVDRFATKLYRVDSKKREIQFFIGSKKYTLKIADNS